MHQYIVDTEFAIVNLLDVAFKEEDLLTAKMKALKELQEKLEHYKWDFNSSDLNDDFTEAYVMHAFARMSEAAKESDTVGNEVSTLLALIGTHQLATQAIASAVLQIAKQGIALACGGLSSAPEGRKIGSLSVRDIIWQGRNQAMHYEEGSFRPAVTYLFTELESKYGAEFSLTTHANQCRAKQIIRLLSWATFDDYAKDMSMILL